MDDTVTEKELIFNLFIMDELKWENEYAEIKGASGRKELKKKKSAARTAFDNNDDDVIEALTEYVLNSQIFLVFMYQWDFDSMFFNWIVASRQGTSLSSNFILYILHNWHIHSRD